MKKVEVYEEKLHKKIEKVKVLIADPAVFFYFIS